MDIQRNIIFPRRKGKAARFRTGDCLGVAIGIFFNLTPGKKRKKKISPDGIAKLRREFHGLLCRETYSLYGNVRCSYGPRTNFYRNFNPFTLNVLLPAFKAIAFNAREMNETERLRITRTAPPGISLRATWMKSPGM